MDKNSVAIMELLPWDQLFWFWMSYKYVGPWGDEENWFRQFKRFEKYQMTVVSITHDLEEVAMSDRVLVMKKAKWSQPAAQENFFFSDWPWPDRVRWAFTNQLRESLRETG